MKIICQKDTLLKGVTIVMKAVSSRTTMDILKCILIEANAGQIKLTANDMELGIETSIEGEIASIGSIAIDAKILYEIVRKLPDFDVVIETDANNSISIVCGKANFKISGQPADDFVNIPNVEKNSYVSLSQFTLREMIKQTIFSIADNENNKIMTGECISIKNNVFQISSLDGCRISLRKIKLENDYEDVSVIVPGKTLNEINKILNGDIDKEVLIFFTQNHILFEFEETIVVSRLIDGEFFNIDHFLTKDYETKVTINRRDLLSCIDRATLLDRESDKKPIVIGINEDKMELKLISELGSLREDISIDKKGKDLLIALSPRFVIEALRAIDDEMIDLYFVNNYAPCVIKDDENDFKYLYLVVPIKYQED